MAIRKFYLGSLGPYYFDDTEPVNDPDGDFAGATRKAVLTDGDVEATTVTNTSGYTGTVDIVVDVQDNAGTVEKKTQTLTFANGLLDSVSSVSAWTPI